MRYRGQLIRHRSELRPHHAPTPPLRLRAVFHRVRRAKQQAAHRLRPGKKGAPSKCIKPVIRGANHASCTKRNHAPGDDHAPFESRTNPLKHPLSPVSTWWVNPLRAPKYLPTPTSSKIVKKRVSSCKGVKTRRTPSWHCSDATTCGCLHFTFYLLDKTVPGPRYVPAFLQREGFSIPRARRVSSNFAISRFSVFLASIVAQEVTTSTINSMHSGEV